MININSYDLLICVLIYLCFLCFTTASAGHKNGNTIAIVFFIGLTEGPTWIFETKRPDPDLHKDGFIDFLDFSKLALRWLETCSGPGWCDGVDLDWSEKVALPDLQIIAEAWLEGIK